MCTQRAWTPFANSVTQLTRSRGYVDLGLPPPGQSPCLGIRIIDEWSTIHVGYVRDFAQQPSRNDRHFTVLPVVQQISSVPQRSSHAWQCSPSQSPLQAMSPQHEFAPEGGALGQTPEAPESGVESLVDAESAIDASGFENVTSGTDAQPPRLNARSTIRRMVRSVPRSSRQVHRSSERR